MVDGFEEYYCAWFKGFKLSDLVKHELILSDMLELDVVLDSLLCDETIVMREIVRDEIISRLRVSTSCVSE